MVLVSRLGVVEPVTTPKVEAFYWAAITLSQTLGTALGDWIADTGGLGYEGGAVVFAAGLAVTAALYYWTDVSRVLLFWAAFILTRPLGATLGDFLDKPLDHGGLALSRPIASAILAAIMIACVLTLPQRAATIGEGADGCKPERNHSNWWRPRPESNRGARICSPLRHHSATWPKVRKSKDLRVSRVRTYGEFATQLQPPPQYQHPSS